LRKKAKAGYSMKNSAIMIALGITVTIVLLTVAGLTAFPKEPKIPFINPELGDLVLFAFVLSGAVSGFITGYYWRRLVAEKGSEEKVG